MEGQINKHEVDCYSIALFNPIGARIAEIALGNVGLIRAIRYGEDKKNAGECASFRINRVLYNSLDLKDWEQSSPAGRFADGKPVGYES